MYIARADHRAVLRPFLIPKADRLSHCYLIGRTGVGKTTVLRILAAQDLRRGQGFAFVDPHGDVVDRLLEQVPEERSGDVMAIDGVAGGWHFNPLQAPRGADTALHAAGLVDVFRKIWEEDWGPRLEHLWRNVVLTLLAVPGATLGDVPRLLTDFGYRRGVVSGLSDEIVRAFWFDEYDRYSPRFRSVVVAPLQNKIGALLTDKRLRAILTAKKSSFDLREIMDEGGVLLINLAKGRMGEGPSSLLGSLLVSHLALAGLARADQPEDERRPFFIYLDEFHTFSTTMLATMLSELRKYKVGMVLAHQYLSQLEPEIRDAVLGNVGTLICFRVGAKDAGFLAREMSPVFSADDLLSLPNYHIYVKLMINGQVSRPFSAQTFASIDEIPGYGRAA